MSDSGMFDFDDLFDDDGEFRDEAFEDAGAVTSPMVGTAYLSPEPGAAAFVKVGDSVSERNNFV